MIQLLSTKLK